MTVIRLESIGLIYAYLYKKIRTTTINCSEKDRSVFRFMQCAGFVPASAVEKKISINNVDLKN